MQGLQSGNGFYQGPQAFEHGSQPGLPFRLDGPFLDLGLFISVRALSDFRNSL